ncbi:hypothetical protein ABE26_21435 [Cytobacillus firmus]|nr:hypothetical protein [Cytobacillus firmus]
MGRKTPVAEGVIIGTTPQNFFIFFSPLKGILKKVEKNRENLSIYKIDIRGLLQTILNRLESPLVLSNATIPLINNRIIIITINHLKSLQDTPD